MEVVTIIISLVDKLLGKLPDYKERKQKEWSELKQDYLAEINKPLSERDADKILNMRDEILLLAKEISK